MADTGRATRQSTPLGMDAGETGKQSIPEGLQLHGSDHPGMILVSTLLTKNNYLTWSYAVTRALRAKMKLGFIDDTYAKPSITDPHFEQWIRVDSMLQREIASLMQGNKSVVEYFSRLRMIWDELDVLMPVPQCTCGCTCGAFKTAADQATFTRLIQFLMGLSETFDHLRDQLLVMDPIPTVNKAYSMVLRVEKQREVSMEGAESGESMVMQVRRGGRRDYTPKYGQQKAYADKRGMHCSNCDRSEHMRDTCFKLHDTPEWYKELIEKRKKEAGAAKAFNTHTEISNSQHKAPSQEVLLQELIRLMKKDEDHGQIHDDPLRANYAQLDNFAGKSYISSGFHDNSSNFWIVDTGATNHMCAHKHMFQSFLSSSQPTLIYLPNGTTQSVTHKGTINLHPHLTLTDVLFVPQFHHNLLSVSKLCSHSNLEMKFHSSCCLLQDPVTNKVIAIGRLCKNLYVLDKSSFDPTVIAFLNSITVGPCTVPAPCDHTLWHRRLGHPSSLTLKHLPDIEPRSYREASLDTKWVAAMNKELAALDRNHTWTLVSLPPGKKAIRCRWVFKLKLNPDGSIQRYKARLVAKGYNQIEGVDYFDSFSLVAKTISVRVLLTVVVARGWPLWQLDVNNDFLHGHLDERGDSAEEVAALKDYLHSLFTIKDLDFAKYFLGLELARSSHELIISQQKYLADILADTHLLAAKPTSTPLPPGLHLTDATGSLLPDPSAYRRLVGRLLYLGFTRPDISFAVQQLSQFLQHPMSSHWDTALYVLRYLKGSSSLGLFFPSTNSLQPMVYTDVSWVSCPDSCRSVIGYCIFLGPSLVS
ncbi:UNVERIFIED_CONTAM: Retrovirus-related Pol polyprotein from transposon RE2 [Sesamum indicum]